MFSEYLLETYNSVTLMGATLQTDSILEAFRTKVLPIAIAVVGLLIVFGSKKADARDVASTTLFALIGIGFVVGAVALAAFDPFSGWIR